MNTTQKLLIGLFIALVAGFFIGRWSQHANKVASPPITESHTPPSQSSPTSSKTSNKKRRDIPQEAIEVLHYVREHHVAPNNYVGGREFKNRERRLQQRTAQGTYIHYQEWDIYPKIKNKNRGPERLITGDDESAWYTGDHYQTFIPINE
jgi:ribonuclease T1